MTEEELINKFESDNITLAPFSKRILAFGIDELMVAVLILVAFFDILKSESDQMQILMRILPYLLFLKLIYHGFFVSFYGATLGKMAAKIRVIELRNGETPNYAVSFIRSFVRIVSESAYWVGFLWALFNPKRQTWHDIAAKTIVINA